MSALEFLNMICYHNDKVEKQNKEIDKWKMTH